MFAARVGRRKRCAGTPVLRWFLKRCNGSATTMPGWPTSSWSAADPARVPVAQRPYRIVQQPTTEGVLEPQLLEQLVGGTCGNRRFQGRPQSAATPFGVGLPHPGRVRCGLHVHSQPAGLQHQLKTGQTKRLSDCVDRLSVTVQSSCRERCNNRLPAKGRASGATLPRDYAPSAPARTGRASIPWALRTH